MWLHRSIFIHIVGYILVISADSFDDTVGHSSSLERKLMIKLKTASRLKHNFGKILHELPIQSYELYYSVKTIEDYLKNGGSLIECLNVLSSIMYTPIEEQIDDILKSMEDHLPKYLMPAISLIRRSLLEGVLDVDEIYRPTWGPPKSDLLEKIPLRELKEAALPLSYREPVESLEGPWPKIVGETASLINHKIISSHQELIAYVLANLRIPNATTEVRESIELLVEHLRSHGKRELTGFRTSFDPYELVVNAISSLSLQNEALIAADMIRPFLKKPSKCRGSSEFISFLQNNALNYTFLVSQDKIISNSKIGTALLFMIQENSPDMQNIIEQFFPFQYTYWRDLLLAFVSHLRRLQTYQGTISDVVNSVYGELILKDAQKRWRLLRNSIITASILSATARRESSVRIRRLLIDVASDRSIKSKVWRNTLAFGSSKDISGSVDAVLKTLKALQASELIPYDILRSNVAELINIYDNRTNQEWTECNSRLNIYMTNFTQALEPEIGGQMKITDVDVEDLLQTLPDLDIYTDEYASLKSFLSLSDVIASIGQMDINAHPTRGRLLARLLQMMGHADGIDDNLRHLAKQFANNVAYEGYGAGALRFN